MLSNAVIVIPWGVRGEVLGLRQRTVDNLLMSVVGVVFAVNILLLSGVATKATPAIEALVILGWIVLVAGALLVILSFVTLRRSGIDNLVNVGVYKVVRHPMYVGGMMMFISHALFGQSVVIGLSTFVGLCCCYLLVRLEDLKLIEKFGRQYEKYALEVPGVNLLLGLARALRR